jgi:ATP-dependent Clp protease adaptor protein ClpS
MSHLETETITEVLVEEAVDSGTDAAWRVVLFNDEVHTFESVIVQLIKATGCHQARAEAFAWTVHTTGRAIVFGGRFDACFRVSNILEEIHLMTEIRG